MAHVLDVGAASSMVHTCGLNNFFLPGRYRVCVVELRLCLFGSSISSSFLEIVQLCRRHRFALLWSRSSGPQSRWALHMQPLSLLVMSPLLWLTLHTLRHSGVFVATVCVVGLFGAPA